MCERLIPVAVAPAAHLVKDGNRGFTLVRETVFHLRRNLRVFFTMDQIVCLQLLARGAQGFAGDRADIFLHFIVNADRAAVHFWSVFGEDDVRDPMKFLQFSEDGKTVDQVLII